MNHANVTPIKSTPAKKRRTVPARPQIRRNAGVVEQVRVALAREHRLATFIGALLGAFVPFATFVVAHCELGGWRDPRGLLVLGGLLFSARTVYQWGRLALDSWPKALGFTVLVEGVMVASSQRWLAVLALVYLSLINAVATGVTLARGAASVRPTEDM